MVQVDEIPVRLSGARERASGGTDEPVETAMKTFEFRVIASGPDLERDEHGLIEGLVLLATDSVALLGLAAVIRDGGGETQAKANRAA